MAEKDKRKYFKIFFNQYLLSHNAYTLLYTNALETRRTAEILLKNIFHRRLLSQSIILFY